MTTPTAIKDNRNNHKEQQACRKFVSIPLFAYALRKFMHVCENEKHKMFTIKF